MICVEEGGMDVLVNPTEPPRIRRKFRREFATALSAFLECASNATNPATPRCQYHP